MKRVEQLIQELQNLPEEYKQLPVLAYAENGLLLEAKIRLKMRKDTDSPLMGHKPEEIVITWG